MHQPILMYSNVYERSEFRNVGDHTLQHHPRLNIGDLPHMFMEGGRNEFITRIAAWLAQLGKDIVDSVGAGGQPVAVYLLQQLRRANELVDSGVERRRNLFDDRVRFRMYGRHVERIVSVANAQK